MTGLGNIFITTKMKYIIPKIKYLIVRLINANSNWLIFQNPDDKRYFKTICKYKFNKNTLITPGSGIKILKRKIIKLLMKLLHLVCYLELFLEKV